MRTERSRPGLGTEAANVLAGELNWYQDTTRGIDIASLVALISARVVTHDAISREGVA